MASIVWFRLDLRMADNRALQAAVARGRPIVPVYIHAPEEETPWEPGGASRWWSHHSLLSLSSALRQARSKLIIRRGPSLQILRDLVSQTGASAVFWNRRYEPAAIERDAKVEQALREEGLKVESFNAALLHEPWTIRNQSGKPFQVFTPFWKHCLAQSPPPEPLPKPKHLPAPASWPKSLDLDELKLEPRIDWAGGLRGTWQPGAAGAARNLERFLRNSFDGYVDQRNRPDLVGTSRLSPHLHFGEISPRQVWHAVGRLAGRRGFSDTQWPASRFLTEVVWREFAHHLLYHFPRTPAEPLRPAFAGFPWNRDERLLESWQRGRTGFPIVDAGMRELWQTGWMHNRVRMVVASFLVKDLLLPWQTGAHWFWETLVDADLAQNTLGWQWTAGCGADAAPYFRIFNPVSQGEKFDPCGAYVRSWCPELGKLPNRWIHNPAIAPVEVLKQAGVRLGENYPDPIVNHAAARELALKAFATIKSTRRRSEKARG